MLYFFNSSWLRAVKPQALGCDLLGVDVADVVDVVDVADVADVADAVQYPVRRHHQLARAQARARQLLRRLLVASLHQTQTRAPPDLTCHHLKMRTRTWI